MKKHRKRKRRVGAAKYESGRSRGLYNERQKKHLDEKENTCYNETKERCVT